jgi:subfamily B ATP-binding cassette protein MsbA
VCFKYASRETKAIEHLDLIIEPGETVAFVGKSGSGKTTIVNLLPRFYDIDSGVIKIDGVSTNELSLSSLRDQIAIVNQDVILFNDTIANNIAYAQNIEANDKRLIEAAEAARVLEFTDKLPNKLNTLVGENGVLLSGGQCQRIAIARALLKDAPILILDEATSALDTESEQYIKKALELLQKDRTTLVIAHRLSTIESADRIVVMDKGEIVEIGSHKELLNKDKAYAGLYKMQINTPNVAVNS